MRKRQAPSNYVGRIHAHPPVTTFASCPQNNVRNKKGIISTQRRRHIIQRTRNFFFVLQKNLAKKASTTCRPRIQAWLLNNYCSLDCCTYIQVCDAPKNKLPGKKNQGRGCLQKNGRLNPCHAFFGKANSTVVMSEEDLYSELFGCKNTT